MTTLARLQATLDHEIPIAKAIGITALRYQDGCLTLGAPLQPNINHKATAFAGSLNALVTLTCWSLIWLLLDAEALPGTIVIQDSSIAYLRPITQDFAATACLPTDGSVERFLAFLRKKNRARLELHAEIRQDDQLAVQFHGRYVVTRTSTVDSVS